jgi:uncharacterized protein (TIGR00251 family)
MDDIPLHLKETADGVEARIHVQPHARRNEIVGTHGGALKIKISAPPVDDAANRAIVDFFAALLGVPKSRVSIASGLKSRDKTIFIEGITAECFRSRV